MSNSKELKVKYHGNKDKKSKARKKNPNVSSVSKLGYRDDSPYRSLPYIDIHTPDGSIDMSGTGIPLWANGRILPPYSGIHQFDTDTVREIPLAQDGGDYNMERAKQLYTADKAGHWPSVDYETGEWLKSKEHPTAWMEYLYGYTLNPQQALRYDVRTNPQGYFGDNTLQYVSKHKKGGWRQKYQVPPGEVTPFVTSDLNEYNRRKQAYADSLSLYKQTLNFYDSPFIEGTLKRTESRPFTQIPSRFFQGDNYSRYLDPKNRIMPIINMWGQKSEKAEYPVFAEPVQEVIFKKKDPIIPIQIRELKQIPINQEEIVLTKPEIPPAPPFVDYEGRRTFTAAGYPMVDTDRSSPTFGKTIRVPKGYIPGSEEEKEYRSKNTKEKGGSTKWLKKYQTTGGVNLELLKVQEEIADQQLKEMGVEEEPTIGEMKGDTVYSAAKQLPTVHVTDTLPERFRDQQKSQFIQNLGNLDTGPGYGLDIRNALEQAIYGNTKWAMDDNNPYDPAVLSENDALRIYLGLNQNYGSFMPSKYQRGAYDLAEGYQKLFPEFLPKDEKEIQKYLDNADDDKALMNESNTKRIPNPFMPYGDIVMGRHQLKRGSDEKGDYIEYYDEWDLDTLGLAGIISDKTIGTPFKIRGRVYYDKKTGKRIDEYAPKYEPYIKYKKKGGPMLPKAQKGLRENYLEASDEKPTWRDYMAVYNSAQERKKWIEENYPGIKFGYKYTYHDPHYYDIKYNEEYVPTDPKKYYLPGKNPVLVDPKGPLAGIDGEDYDNFYGDMSKEHSYQLANIAHNPQNWLWVAERRRQELERGVNPWTNAPLTGYPTMEEYFKPLNKYQFLQGDLTPFVFEGIEQNVDEATGEMKLPESLSPEFGLYPRLSKQGPMQKFDIRIMPSRLETANRFNVNDEEDPMLMKAFNLSNVKDKESPGEFNSCLGCDSNIYHYVYDLPEDIPYISTNKAFDTNYVGQDDSKQQSGSYGSGQFYWYDPDGKVGFREPIPITADQYNDFKKQGMLEKSHDEMQRNNPRNKRKGGLTRAQYGRAFMDQMQMKSATNTERSENNGVYNENIEDFSSMTDNVETSTQYRRQSNDPNSVPYFEYFNSPTLGNQIRTTGPNGDVYSKPDPFMKSFLDKRIDFRLNEEKKKGGLTKAQYGREMRKRVKKMTKGMPYPVVPKSTLEIDDNLIFPTDESGVPIPLYPDYPPLNLDILENEHKFYKDDYQPDFSFMPPMMMRKGGPLPKAQLGNEPVPTFADSVALYNNALAKIKFYENNPDYRKKKKSEISFPTDFKNANVRREIIKDLINKINDKNWPLETKVDNSLLNEVEYIAIKTGMPLTSTEKAALKAKIGETKFGKVKGTNLYSFGDILRGEANTYFNPLAPPIYLHPNIAPQGYEMYRSDRFKDNSEMPYYDPIAIKPESLRTPAEQKEWEEKYGSKKDSPIPIQIRELKQIPINQEEIVLTKPEIPPAPPFVDYESMTFRSKRHFPGDFFGAVTYETRDDRGNWVPASQTTYDAVKKRWEEEQKKLREQTKDDALTKHQVPPGQIKYVNSTDDPLYKAAQDSAQMYLGSLQAFLKDKDVKWRLGRKPTEKDYGNEKSGASLGYIDKLTTSEKNKLKVKNSGNTLSSNFQGYTEEVDISPGNPRRSGTIDFFAKNANNPVKPHSVGWFDGGVNSLYYKKPVNEVILVPTVAKGVEGYDPPPPETIMMPSGAIITKDEFIKQYGQGAWDRATNKKKTGGPLPMAQTGIPKKEVKFQGPGGTFYYDSEGKMISQAVYDQLMKQYRESPQDEKDQFQEILKNETYEEKKAREMGYSPGLSFGEMIEGSTKKMRDSYGPTSTEGVNEFAYTGAPLKDYNPTVDRLANLEGWESRKTYIPDIPRSVMAGEWEKHMYGDKRPYWATLTENSRYIPQRGRMTNETFRSMYGDYDDPNQTDRWKVRDTRDQQIRYGIDPYTGESVSYYPPHYGITPPKEYEYLIKQPGDIQHPLLKKAGGPLPKAQKGIQDYINQARNQGTAVRDNTNAPNIPQRVKMQESIDQIEKDIVNLSEEDFTKKYGTNQHGWQYENRPAYKAKVDARIRAKEAAGMPMIKKRVEVNPNLRFMAPNATSAEQAQNVIDYNLGVIGATLPIPGLQSVKMSAPIAGSSRELPSLFGAANDLITGVPKTLPYSANNVTIKNLNELSPGFNQDPYYHFNLFHEKKDEVAAAVRTPEGRRRLQALIDNKANTQLHNKSVDEHIRDFENTLFVTEIPQYTTGKPKMDPDNPLLPMLDKQGNPIWEIAPDYVRNPDGSFKMFPVAKDAGFIWEFHGPTEPAWLAMGPANTPYDATHFLAHEFGHLFQRGDFLIGVDDVLSKISLKDYRQPPSFLERLSQMNPFNKTKDIGFSKSNDIFYPGGMNPENIRKQLNYWLIGSNQREKAAFAAEVRENMLLRGLLKNRYDEITPELLQKHYKLYKNTKGPKYMLRLYDFMDNKKENFKFLSEALNNMLTVTGTGLTFGLMNGLSETKTEKKTGGSKLPSHLPEAYKKGGWLNKYKK